MKKYVYVLKNEDFEDFLLNYPSGVEIIERKENIVKFATYEPLKELKPEKVEEVSKDWEKWKEKFKPVDIEDFVIIPPWKIPIFINPGMAFGTGLHPTTQLCIKALKEYVKEGYSVLDVGTGSGILAIVSKILGAKEVVAIDISEEAVRECKENVRLNNVEIKCIKAEPKDIKERYDIVVANLEIKIFRETIEDIKKLIKKYGIFSGLYKREDLEEFKGLIEDFKILKVYEKEEWYCVVIQTN